MSQEKAIREVSIVNPQGLHLRPAYLFAELAARFQSDVYLCKDDERVDGKSILSIVTLGAKQGSRLAIEAAGEDAQAAIAALAEMVESGFPAPEEETTAPRGAAPPESSNR